LEIITSRNNRLIKHIRKLTSDREYRRSSGLFFGEGPKLLAEALKAGTVIEGVVTARGVDLPGLDGLWRAEVPAERTNWPPLPGCISMLWMTVPTGMLARGRALPGLISAAAEEITLSPAPRPTGARIYRRSPSSYSRRAMLAERLGSYSRRRTVAKQSCLSRLKSMTRYLRLLPPPRWRTVMRP